MKTRLLLAFCLLVCLTACEKRIARPANSAWLSPTVIEGKYASLDALMADPTSTGSDLLNFAGQAGDAVLRCNADKNSELKGNP